MLYLPKIIKDLDVFIKKNNFFKNNFQQNNNELDFNIFDNPLQYNINKNNLKNNRFNNFPNSFNDNQINNDEKIIFNSNSSSWDYFVFSLDNLMIYYSRNGDGDINNNIPKLSIINNYGMQCSRGTETQNSNNDNNKIYWCKLSAKTQFNISRFELYEIKLSI